MPPSTMRAFKSALEQRKFDRVYLFHGDDDYLKEEKIRALIDRATDPGTRDFNLEDAAVRPKPTPARWGSRSIRFR